MRRRSRQEFRNDYLKRGDHNVIDDLTGFKEKASNCRILTGSQQGLLCHKNDWNPAQPQLYLSSKPDDMNVQIVRLPPPDQFPPSPSPGDL